MRRGKRYDIMSEDRIKSVLKTETIGQKIFAFWSISTTNDFAYRMAEQGEREGALVIAEQQERGRGRNSRTWISPFSKGLWFSLILRPELPSAQAGLIPYVASVSVAEAVENKLALKPSLKWPNDLLIKQKKICGILSEVEFLNGKIKFIILGIGINVNQMVNDFPAELIETATSLRVESETVIDRAELLAEILERFEQNYLQTKAGSFENILTHWKKRCPNIGRPISIRQEENIYHGIFKDIDKNGYLILQAESGAEEKIVAGDLVS